MRCSSRPLVLSLVVALAASGTLAATATARPLPDDPDPAAVQRSTSQAPADSALDVDHGLHGGGEGHLPPTRNNVDVVGKAAVSNRAEGRVADVAVRGRYAYLASYAEPDCTRGGVYVFDISNRRQGLGKVAVHDVSSASGRCRSAA